MTFEEILEIAKSVKKGSPTKACPIPFSYVSASMALAEFILDWNEEMKDEIKETSAAKE